MTDGELSAHLDDPDDWFVLDDAGRLLVRSISLRHALRQVRFFMSGGVRPASLIRDSEPMVTVRSNQLARIYETQWDCRPSSALLGVGRPIRSVASSFRWKCGWRTGRGGSQSVIWNDRTAVGTLGLCAALSTAQMK